MKLSMFSCSHFLSNRAECHVQESSRTYSKRGVGSGVQLIPMKFVSKTLLSAKIDPPQDLSDPNSPGKRELDQSCCATPTSTQQCILKRGNKVTLNRPAPGNWGGVVNPQAQTAPGNWSEVMTSKSEGQGWNSRVCKSPTIDTLKESSRICRKSRISQKTHRQLVSKR